jgi:cobalt-zinc-cadmium efflux system outer membrane protein
VHTVTIGMPFPLWDRNRGNIIAAEGTLVRASEEPHRVETTLTTTLANNYNNYKNALDALEYYRRYILPDQVRAYRGVYARRQIDATSAFGDLVQAQQTLATNVGTYLTILGQLWTSVVSVADLLQTDDLFQMAQPREVPALPDLDHLPDWPCCHDRAITGSHPAAPTGVDCPVQAANSVPSLSFGLAPVPEQIVQPLSLPRPVSLPPVDSHGSVPLPLLLAPTPPRPMVGFAPLTSNRSHDGGGLNLSRD